MSTPLHENRARAESFGAIAAAYDRFRPTYPDALVDDLVALSPRSVLDVACGTGKAAVLLAARGVSVLGVEIDLQMAEVARSHGITVEVGDFEGWRDAGRRFDLITCAQGWHWIDPVRGPAKAAELLEPGGTLALFWNHDHVDEPLRAKIAAAYVEHAPAVPGTEPYDRYRDEPYVNDLRAADVFADIVVRHYKWQRTYSADEWVGRAATQSDHSLLPEQVRAALLDELRAAIESEGGSVLAHFGTYTIQARKAG